MQIDDEGSRVVGLNFVRNRNLQRILMQKVVVESCPEVETRAYFLPLIKEGL